MPQEDLFRNRICVEALCRCVLFASFLTRHSWDLQKCNGMVQAKKLSCRMSLQISQRRSSLWTPKFCRARRCEVLRWNAADEIMSAKYGKLPLRYAEVKEKEASLFQEIEKSGAPSPSSWVQILVIEQIFDLSRCIWAWETDRRFNRCFRYKEKHEVNGPNFSVFFMLLTSSYLSFCTIFLTTPWIVVSGCSGAGWCAGEKLGLCGRRGWGLAPSSSAKGFRKNFSVRKRQSLQVYKGQTGVLRLGQFSAFALVSQKTVGGPLNHLMIWRYFHYSKNLVNTYYSYTVIQIYSNLYQWSTQQSSTFVLSKFLLCLAMLSCSFSSEQNPVAKERRNPRQEAKVRGPGKLRARCILPTKWWDEKRWLFS